jgi:hypothetical protein
LTVAEKLGLDGVLFVAYACLIRGISSKPISDKCNPGMKEKSAAGRLRNVESGRAGLLDSLRAQAYTKKQVHF